MIKIASYWWLWLVIFSIVHSGYSRKHHEVDSSESEESEEVSSTHIF